MSGGVSLESWALVAADTVKHLILERNPSPFVNSDILVDNRTDSYVPLKAPNSKAPSCSSARQADE